MQKGAAARSKMHFISQEALVLSVLQFKQCAGVSVHEAVYGIRCWVKILRAVDGTGMGSNAAFWFVSVRHI